MRIGIIDCGTNTFNLLIGDLNDTWTRVFSTKFSVMLGFGLNDDGIRPTRYARGIDAMCALKEIATNYRCDQIKAIGTSALRESPNGEEFVAECKKLTGIDIQIITGMKEAELIHRGVNPLLGSEASTDLIMDIGGGSVEFIICNRTEVLWSESVRIGVATIRQNIRPSDPMTTDDLSTIRTLMESSLKEVLSQCEKHGVERLIGSSGSFDTFNAILAETHVSDKNFNALDINRFRELHQQLLIQPREERLLISGMHPMRADTITLASSLVDFMLKKTNIASLYQSAFALKEGLISSLAANDWNDS